MLPASENSQLERDTATLPICGNIPATQNKKRTIQELFGDIDDLLSENDAMRAFKKTKTNRSELETIEHIIELRRLAKERQDGASLFLKIANSTRSGGFENNLSYRVPRYPFLAVTRQDGERVYVRCHSEQYEREEMGLITEKCSFKNVMKDMFKDTWKEAEMLLNKQLDKEAQNDMAVVADETIENNNCLWVEIYRPRKYMELLSDETTNRTMLKWMKLWDKVVFNRKPKIKTANADMNFEGKFKNATLENMLKLDENGMPEYKVALLCGPPGLGKNFTKTKFFDEKKFIVRENN